MILVTGANKGLGRETARRLVAEGHDLWAAARNPERGRAAAEELGARPLVLDVTDDASVDKCREHSRSRCSTQKRSQTCESTRSILALPPPI